MSILLVGLNHRTAPVAIREQLAFGPEGVPTALMFFKKQFPGTEAAIINTCNRVEIIVSTDQTSPTAADIISFLAEARDLPVAEFKSYMYQFTDEQACRHFFRVVSGLDSMVLGESQIVNQVKTAYTQAMEQGTTGRVLNRLFHHAFCVSKRVRTDTGITEGKVSVPSVAVDVAKSIFNDFSNKLTLVVGAGEVARLVCQHLTSAQARKFVVMSRTLTNSRAVAEACEGVAMAYDQLDAQLIEADIVIMATSCTQPVLTLERMKQAMKLRQNRMMYIIDLAVPRNVAPEVSKVEGIYLYDVDALGAIVGQNQLNRAAALEQCEKILDEEVAAFEGWLAELKLNPLIAQMYRDARSLRDDELDRLLRACPDLSDRQKQQVTQLVDRLVGKFMHPCIVGVRQSPRALADALHATAPAPSPCLPLVSAGLGEGSSSDKFMH